MGGGMGTCEILHVVGILNDPKFQRCKNIVNAVSSKHKLIEFETRELVETEFDYFMETAAFKSKTFHHPKRHPIIYTSKDQYLGSTKELLEWVAEKCDYQDFSKDADYESIAKHAFNSYMKNSGHLFCYFDIACESHLDLPKRVVFELMSKICPKTCENFRCLCTGEKGQVNEIPLHYQNSVFHRVVKEGWVQGGGIDDDNSDNSQMIANDGWIDLENNGRGDGEGYSIYGKTFPDECFALSHDRPGILSMANSGAHTNGSQFFITLNQHEWLNYKKVAFGKVIEGMDVIHAIANSKTYYERPIEPWTIEKCGEIHPE